MKRGGGEFFRYGDGGEAVRLDKERVEKRDDRMSKGKGRKDERCV